MAGVSPLLTGGPGHAALLVSKEGHIGCKAPHIAELSRAWAFTCNLSYFPAVHEDEDDLAESAACCNRVYPTLHKADAPSSCMKYIRASTVVARARYTLLATAVFSRTLGNVRFKSSAALTLQESDLQEKFVRGSGRGGQAVNTASNAV